MELSEHEKELLRLYHADKRKKKRIILAGIVLAATLLGGSITAYKYQDIWLPYLHFFFKNKEPLPDTTPPSIDLKQSNIEITQGEKINYNNYIESAFDNKDGEITSNVTFNKIDTNILGEHKIFYKVKDKAANIKVSCLDVWIKEAPVVDEEPTVNEPAYIENSTTASPSDNQSQAQETHEPEAPVVNETPATQYFMFSDGYTMENVTEACGSVLRSSGRSGMCSPIQDNDGIYLGMRLDYD